MKITRFELLRWPFIHRDQASRWVPKIMQNDAKMHLKSPQNEHEKIYTPVVQWSKTHAVAWPAKMHQIAFIFVIPGVPLLTSWIQKVLKIVENSLQNDHKKYESRCCIGQKHAPSTDLRKCIETHSFLSLPVLLCSRHGCKIAQNHENQQNSFKNWKIIKKTETKFQSAIRNASKRDQNVKKHWKSKRYINNGPKASYFSKNHVLEPTKITQNRRFPIKT